MHKESPGIGYENVRAGQKRIGIGQVVGRGQSGRVLGNPGHDHKKIVPFLNPIAYKTKFVFKTAEARRRAKVVRDLPA